MTISRLIIIACLITIVGYIGIHLNALFSPPPLELFSPAQGLTTSNKNIEINGKTIPGAIVEVNGEILPLLTNGEFKHLLVLGQGVSTITISAKKRYSRINTIERQIYIQNVNERVSKIKAGGT